jgi:ABC-2 type transport system permease protein
MFRRLRPLIVKEFRQIRRDKRSLGVLLVLPAVLVFVIGYALNFDVKHVRLAVWDQDKTSRSRELVRAFVNNEYFTYAYAADSYETIETLLGKGDALIGLVVPPSFSRDIAAGRDATVQILVDGSNANTATAAIDYTNAVLQSFSVKLSADVMQRVGKAGFLPIDYRPKVWYNPELITAKFLVPGLIGFILMISAVVSTSLSVVKEKERGTMEQIMVSPLNTAELIVGKTIPYLAVGLAGSVLVLLVGFLLFDIVVHGSIFWLYIGIVLFLIGALGQGLLISTVAQSQQVAFLLSVFSSLLPTFLLSGFVFPIRSMPIALQLLSNAAPAKFFLVVVRSIILKGAGPAAFWDQLVFLMIFAAVMLGISVVRLRKRVQ